MSASLEPVVEFLSRSAPFHRLTPDALADLAGKWDIEYFRRGSQVRRAGEEAQCLYLVRAGALTETDEAGLLVARLGEGELAGVEDLLSNQSSRTSLWATEDTLVYRLSRQRFERLLLDAPQLARWLSAQVSQRLQAATLELSSAEPSFSSMSLVVGSLVQRSLVWIEGRATIREAAQKMKQERVSALVVDVDSAWGIVTDRDLRNRVLAAGYDLNAAVRDVMSSPVVTIDQGALVFEALVTMLEHQIHHLVVTQGGHPVGVVTTTDLIRVQSENPVHVVGDIMKQTSLEGLVHVSRKRAGVLVRLMASGARAVDVHRILSRIADATTRRLLTLAEAQLAEEHHGAMPAYSWLVFGSLARQELSLGSDQDSAMVLGPDVDPDDPAASFVARRVCEGLDACGYPKCRGEIMAMTPRFRQPLPVWLRYFQGWIREPEKKAILFASIFFDQRVVAGDAGLARPLLELIVHEPREKPLFLAYMAEDALSRHAPLGLFRQFVVEKSGDHVDTLDLKHKGIIPIVDLARVFALESGHGGPNTLERLEAARSGGTLSSSGCSELVSAYEFITQMRLRHQGAQVARGEPADSYLRPEDLSSTERRHLREAFKVVKTMQESLQISHQLGRLGG